MWEYTGNPTGSSIFDVGGGFLDLQVTGADLGDRVEAKFYYPSSITGQQEEDLVLMYHTGTDWKPVRTTLFGGRPTKDTTDNQDGTVSGGSFSATFTWYSRPSIMQLTGTVFTFTTDDTPPVAVTNGPFTVYEGGTVTLDGGASTDNLGLVDIAWDIDGEGYDDGDPVTYKAVDGPATVTMSLRAVDGAGNEAIATTQVTVNNVPPLVSAGGNKTSVEGETVSLTDTYFIDVGVEDTHTATINWGDGTGAQPATVDEAGGGGAVLGSHVYGDNGAYTVTVCVTDDDGGTRCDQLTITVANVTPSIEAGPNQSAGGLS